jgi:hypothetical protein
MYLHNIKDNVLINHTSPFGEFFSFVFFFDFLGLRFCLAGLLAGVVSLEAIECQKQQQSLALELYM